MPNPNVNVFNAYQSPMPIPSFPPSKHRRLHDRFISLILSLSPSPSTLQAKLPQHLRFFFLFVCFFHFFFFHFSFHFSRLWWSRPTTKRSGSSRSWRRSSSNK